jgi:GT2 family glycosyltransferase
MKSHPKTATVTVVIVNWNSGDLLKQCLVHLTRQTFHPFQVIIVDNGSTDQSIQSIKAEANCKIMALTQNTGFAHGNNVAISRCDSTYVALLNPDAFPEPNWLRNLIDAAINHPDVAAFGSRQMEAENPGILDGIGDAYHISGKVWRTEKGRPYISQANSIAEIFSPCACAALYRRDAVLAVGGFDEDYFCYVEDVDLGFRLRLAGYQALYVPTAVVHHLGSAITGGRRSDFSVYHGQRNLVWTYVKNMPGALFWIFLPLHLVLNIAAILYYCLRSQHRVIWRAKFDACKNLPSMLKKRRIIQRNRQVPVASIWRVLAKRLPG